MWFEGEPGEPVGGDLFEAVEVPGSHRVCQELPRLPGDVGAGVPRVGAGVEGAVCEIADLLVPRRFRVLGRLDRVEPVLVEVADARLDPGDVPFAAEGHRVQHSGGLGTVDHEQVRETRDRHTQVGVEPAVPLLGETHTAPTLGVELQHRAADGVEAGGEHQHVDGVLAVAGLHARRRERRDRVVAEVDERHVVAVVGLEIAVVEDQPLRPEKVVGFELPRRLGVLHDRADLAPDEVAHFLVQLLVGQHPGVAVDREVDATRGPQLLVAGVALLWRVVPGLQPGGGEGPATAAVH